MPFRPATKLQRPARVLLTGIAKAGKTYTALQMATAFCDPGDRIALIDSENGSADLYADLFRYDVLTLTRFSVEDYLAAMLEAQTAGYKVLIIDSISHEWAGTGGVLEFKDRLVKAGQGNDFSAWREATPKHNSFIQAIQTWPGHVICTVRLKTDYQVETIAGKMTPKKVGLAPIQREGFEYEVDVVIEMDEEHRLTVKQTRCSVLDGYSGLKSGTEVARTLKTWLDQGQPVQLPPMSAAALRALYDAGKARLGAEFVPTYFPDGPALRAAVTAVGFADYDVAREGELRRKLYEYIETHGIEAQA